MRSFGLWTMAAVAMALAACGGDASVAGSGGSSAQGGGTSSGAGGTTSSGSGGNSSSGTGGSTSSGSGGGSTSSGSGGGSTSSGSGGGTTGNLCEQACDYLETDCGFPGACNAIPGLDCSNPSSDCPATCFLNATCAQIATLPTANPDPGLQACLQACQGGGGNCQQCIFQSCSAQMQTCQQTPACVQYVQCIQGCSGDAACVDQCLVDNPSGQATALEGCICSSCTNQCAFCG